MQATVAFLRGDPAAAHRRLLEASELIAAVDEEQANALLIEAVHAGWYAGQDELAESVTRLEGQRLRQTALERLLLRAVAPILGRPADRSDPDGALAEARSAAAGNVPGLVLVCGLALLLGQDQAAQQIGDELSRDLRAAGQIGWLPSVLFYSGSAQAYGGRHQEALPYRRRRPAAGPRHRAAALGGRAWPSRSRCWRRRAATSSSAAS